MKKVQRLSASQISRFAHEHGGCHALWWWEKVAGFKEPPSDPMLRGIVGHSVFEHYLLNNKMPSLEHVRELCKQHEPHLTTRAESILRACTCALNRLPDPRNVHPDQVERGYILRAPELALPVIGFLDLDHPSEARITDYKFRSGLKWARNPQQLRGDVAANLYALAYNYILKHPDGPREKDFRGSMSHVVEPCFEREVLFEHLTIEMASGRNDTIVTGYTFTPDDLKSFYWDFLVPIVHEMKEASIEPDVAKVGHNAPESCFKYGRTCFFYSNCIQNQVFPVDPTINPVRFSQEKTVSASGLLGKLLAASKAQPTPKPEPQPEATSTPEERDAVREVVKTGATTAEVATVVQQDTLTAKGEQIADEAMHALEDHVVVNVVAGPDFEDGVLVRETLLSLFDDPERLVVFINESANKRVFDALAGVCAQHKVPLEFQDDPVTAGFETIAAASRHIVVEFPHSFSKFLVDPLCEHWNLTDADKAEEPEFELPEIAESRVRRSRLPDGRPVASLRMDELQHEISMFMQALTPEEQLFVNTEGPLSRTNSPNKDTLQETLELVLAICYSTDKQYRHLNLKPPPEQFVYTVNEVVEEDAPEQARDLEQEYIENVAKPIIEEQAATEPTPSPAFVQDEPMEAPTPPPPSRKRMLLIGCAPLQGLEGKYVLARDFLEPFFQAAAAASGLPHYLLVDFAKGVNLAVAKLDAAIYSGTVELPQILVYDYRDDAFDKALPVLRRNYDIVIGALRG
jgi:hypothetical protein